MPRKKIDATDTPVVVTTPPEKRHILAYNQFLNSYCLAQVVLPDADAQVRFWWGRITNLLSVIHRQQIEAAWAAYQREVSE